MGVDWKVCDICGETFPDCGEYYVCVTCESYVCSHCYDEQLQKYGDVSEDKDLSVDYGGDALRKCDECERDREKEEVREQVIVCLENVKEYELIEKVKELF